MPNLTVLPPQKQLSHRGWHDSWSVWIAHRWVGKGNWHQFHLARNIDEKKANLKGFGKVHHFLFLKPKCNLMIFTFLIWLMFPFVD